MSMLCRVVVDCVKGGESNVGRLSTELMKKFGEILFPKKDGDKENEGVLGDCGSEGVMGVGSHNFKKMASEKRGIESL